MMSGTNERDTNGRLPGGREAVIVRASLIGIGTNLALAAGKAVTGLMARSIAMVLDAVNNLSDALSSLITIIATRLAGRAPDKHHPLGHGRIEYLSALIMAGMALISGIAESGLPKPTELKGILFGRARHCCPTWRRRGSRWPWHGRRR